MKKKIMFMINSLSCGGAEKSLINIVNNLDVQRFDITIKTIFAKGEFSSQLAKHINHESLLPISNKYLEVATYKLFSKLISPKSIYKIMNKETYDIEVAFLEGLPTKIISASNNDQSKKIAWVHIDLLEHRDSDYSFKNELEQQDCYSNYDKIICVSDSVHSIFEQRFGFTEKLHTLLNPIDEKDIIDKSNESVDALNLDNDFFTFVAVGRLVKQKGFDRLIRVLGRLRDDGIICKVFIIGEGVERPYLETLINKYKLEEQIFLLGYQGNPYPFVKQADAFVLSSRAEGYGLVVAEALILEIPVISMNCAGVNEILDEGKYGLLVENNENDLYLNMKKLIEDRKLLKYYQEKAKIRGKEFSLDNSLRKLEELLYGISL